MAHELIPDEIPTSAVASPHVVRSSRLRVWALFASAVAVAGAAVLTVAPALAPAAPAPAPADEPFPQCGAPDPTQCPGYSPPLNKLPNLNDPVIAPNFGDRMLNPDITFAPIASSPVPVGGPIAIPPAGPANPAPPPLGDPGPSPITTPSPVPNPCPPWQGDGFGPCQGKP
jgi:hypothetical protein